MIIKMAALHSLYLNKMITFQIDTKLPTEVSIREDSADCYQRLSLVWATLCVRSYKW